MTYRARFRCLGSRTTAYTDVSERESNGVTLRHVGICDLCGKRVTLDPKGVRELYPLEWVLKTHYDGRR